MTFLYADEIDANLARAEQSLAAAQALASEAYYDFVASRAYYAAFYAATALLLSEELTFSKHSGVIASIHREFVRTGRLDAQHGKNLNWLFELRGIGDYGGMVHVTEPDAEKAVRAGGDAERHLRRRLFRPRRDAFQLHGQALRRDNLRQPRPTEAFRRPENPALPRRPPLPRAAALPGAELVCAEGQVLANTRCQNRVKRGVWALFRPSSGAIYGR